MIWSKLLTTRNLINYSSRNKHYTKIQQFSFLNSHSQPQQRRQYQQRYNMSTNRNYTINLTLKEESIVNLLVSCARWIEQNPEKVDELRLKDENDEWVGKARTSESVELRIAGGWVRDKLLGAESDDIDISIHPDPITGYKFAKLLETYLEIEGKSELMGTLTTIEAKPDQSKHLETATAIVEDLSIDFVQQRGNETYAENSRIPIASFGTPLDDALRRDLTINALFYNLQSRSVEDITGKGLADLGLVEGIEPCIRTPLPPFETFRDDPLRVIRAVRFAARFGFKIDQELVDAVGREEIRNALKDGKKIARDRVGIEVGKMLMGKHAYRAMQIIHYLNLHELIFLYNPAEAFKSPDTAPNPNHPPVANIPISLIASTIVSRLLVPLSSPPEHPSLYSSLHPVLQFSITDTPNPVNVSEITSEVIKRFYLSSALLPVYDHLILDKRKNPIWIGEKIVMDGLKFKSSDKDWAQKAWDSCDKLSEAVKQYGVYEIETSESVCIIGSLLRERSVHETVIYDISVSRWNTSLFWSLARDLCRGTGENEVDIIHRYNIFIDRVLAAKLDSRAFALPLLNGNEILDVIDDLLGREPFSSLDLSNLTTLDPAKPPAKRKSSAAVAEIGYHIVKWQLQYPEATKDDCREWLRGSERQRVLDWVEEYAPKKVEKGKNKKVKQ